MCANALVAGFLDEPTSQVETSCIPASAPEVVTQDDVVFLGVLNQSIAQSGIMGLAQAGMAQIPAIIRGLLLVVAINSGGVLASAQQRARRWREPAPGG